MITDYSTWSVECGLFVVAVPAVRMHKPRLLREHTRTTSTTELTAESMEDGCRTELAGGRGGILAAAD